MKHTMHVQLPTLSSQPPFSKTTKTNTTTILKLIIKKTEKNTYTETSLTHSYRQVLRILYNTATTITNTLVIQNNKITNEYHKLS